MNKSDEVPTDKKSAAIDVAMVEYLTNPADVLALAKKHRVHVVEPDGSVSIVIYPGTIADLGTPSAGLPTIHDCVNADPRRLEPFYTHWVSALTEQGLHRKSDIAVLLAILSQRANVAHSAGERTSTVASQKTQAAWVGGVCKTCGAATHSCKCAHPGDRDHLLASMLSAPSGNLFAAPKGGQHSTSGQDTQHGDSSGAASFAHSATTSILKAIDDEPELPGTMPDEMWEAIKGDRDAIEEAMRIAVRQTKSGIKERLRSPDRCVPPK